MIFLDDQGVAELKKFLRLTEKVGQRLASVPEERMQAIITMHLIRQLADQLLVMGKECDRGYVPSSDRQN